MYGGLETIKSYFPTLKFSRTISGGSLPYQYEQTKIGNNCYIGPKTIVSKGVSIGNGCIIGANSLVLTDIPPNSKAAGNPCRITKNTSNNI